MWLLPLFLSLLALLFSPGQAQGTIPGGNDLDFIIRDYLEGSSDIEEKFRKAVESYKGPPCTMKPGYDGLAIRQLYDTLVWIGEILCQFRITCFTRYARDFFPLPTGSSAIIASTRGAKDALLLGRWYHLHEPLSILLQHYEEQRSIQGLTEAEKPFALLIYPDLGFGEPLASMGVRGDKDFLKDVREGDLVQHLRYSPGYHEGVDIKALDVGMLARTLVMEGLPGMLLYVYENGLTRVFVVLGSTAKGPTSPTPAGCVSEWELRQGDTSIPVYWELVGRVPYSWSEVIGNALPIVRTLANFVEEMENMEKEKQGGTRGK